MSSAPRDRRSGLVLVTGGVRSGKSAFAERLAAQRGAPVLYVATAEAGDAEMAARIAVHRARRPATWVTLEAPLEPARAVLAHPAPAPTVLIDCLGLLVSNVLHAEGEGGQPGSRLARLGDELVALARGGERAVILVTSEVGSGLLPMSALGRRYCDLLGELNQRLARAASQTYLVVAGLGVELRALATQLEAELEQGSIRE